MYSFFNKETNLCYLIVICEKLQSGHPLTNGQAGQRQKHFAAVVMGLMPDEFIKF
jgi:hypothetical protein